MSAAGQRAVLGDAQRWRIRAGLSYQVLLAVLGAAVVVAFPPRFSLDSTTLISVAAVTLFLAATEWPTKMAGTFAAPMTAIGTAAAILFGPWAMVANVVGFAAIHLRMPRTSPAWSTVIAVLGQAGTMVLNTYAVIGAWAFLSPYVQGDGPPAQGARLAAVVICGLAFQTINNTLAWIAHAICGYTFSFAQLMKPGLIASVYAYFLIAVYSFGGIFAAGLFYVIVAQMKMVQDVIGMTEQLRRLDRARAQAHDMIRELQRLGDADALSFAGDVQHIAQLIARNVGMPADEVRLVGLAAELHEIGKARLPQGLRREGGLTGQELGLYHAYPRAGAIMLRQNDALFPREVADMVEFHREAYDGTGFPRGLAGDRIPLGARIVGVARTYVGMLTGHEGVPLLEKNEALAALREGSGTRYDPEIVATLERVV